MKEQRRGEIAVMCVRQKFMENGIRLSSNFRREVGNAAKQIGISTEEAMEFVEGFVRELIKETFALPAKQN